MKNKIKKILFIIPCLASLFVSVFVVPASAAGISEYGFSFSPHLSYYYPDGVGWVNTNVEVSYNSNSMSIVSELLVSSSIARVACDLHFGSLVGENCSITFNVYDSAAYSVTAYSATASDARFSVTHITGGFSLAFSGIVPEHIYLALWYDGEPFPGGIYLKDFVINDPQGYPLNPDLPSGSEPPGEITGSMDDLKDKENNLESATNSKAEYNQGIQNLGDFLSSAVPALGFIRDLFNRLLGSGGLSVLVTASMILAFLPLLLNVGTRADSAHRAKVRREEAKKYRKRSG